MIKIVSLEKEFKLKKGESVKALNGVSFELPDSGLVFISGKSGSGKSTLLNLLGGLDRPTGGEFVLDGKSSKNFTEKDYDAYRNEYVGFVFQDYNLIKQYSVGSNVALVQELIGKKADREQVERLFRMLELIDAHGNILYDRRVNELSAGQKQRVAIARALVKQPRILLADEPTGALDGETGESLYKLLKKLSENMLIVVVTHDKDCAEKYGDRIIELKDGRILSDTEISAERNNGKNLSFECKKPQAGRLSFFRVITMGLAGFKHKKVRLILSVLLASAALCLFGFMLVMRTADPYTAEIKASYNDGAQAIVLCNGVKTIKKTEWSTGNVYSGEIVSGPLPFLPEQIEKLEKHAPVIPVIADNDGLLSLVEYYATDLSSLTFSEKYNPYNYFGVHRLDGVLELDAYTGDTDVGLLPDPRLKNECRLPQSYDEIAITDYAADMFMRFGYRNKDGDGATYQISGPDDLIGKKLFGLTVCGVFSTEQNRAAFKQKYDVSNEFGGNIESYSEDMYLGHIDDFIFPYSRGEHFMRYAFVRRGFYENRFYDYNGNDKKYVGFDRVLYRLSGNIETDKSAIESMTHIKTVRDEFASPEGWSSVTDITKIYCVYEIRSRFSAFKSKVAFLNEDTVILWGTGVCIVFAIFSALLLANFLLADLSERKKEIGILRALGARRSAAVYICLAESMFTAIANFILSVIALGITCSIVNAQIYLPLFIIGVGPFFSVLGVCVVVAACASVIPALVAMRKRPIEIINK